MTVRRAIRNSLGLLSKRDRLLLWISILIQMATSLLDLVGVLLIGLVGALSVTTIQSQPPPPSVTAITDRFGLSSLTEQELVGVLAIAAASVLLTKSVVSSYLTRRVLVFLANRQALVSARLCKALLSKPLTFIQLRSSQETAYALIAGAGAATSQILGQLVIGATEAALLFVLAAALLYLSPGVALGAILFFVLIAFGLQKAMGGWAARVGAESARADIASMNAIQEAISTYREIYVSDRRQLYVDRIQNLRWRAAKVSADTQFIGLFPKYMFEGALVIGGFLLAAVLFTTQDSVTAVGTLALFLAAGTRIMPSLLRLQGAALGLRSAAGAAGPTFHLADDLEGTPHSLTRSFEGPATTSQITGSYPGFHPSITLDGVCLTYPGSSVPALSHVSLHLEAGTSAGLVGKSGAGKSTLADVILGILIPDSGVARIGEMPPDESVVRWPGAIAYVPQDVALVNDSVRANVALGLPRSSIDDGMVWDALRRAHLESYIRSNPEGLDATIGERGLRLSGGQRQRLGIARALYTRPRLLVLDEATSALDAETELAISQTIEELEGQVTTLVIAHRLSTIKSVDVVLYVDDGEIKEQGSFSDLIEKVPAFKRQAALMGIRP